MDNRRHTIVIDKKFQYQYSMLVVALTVLAVNLFVIIRILNPSEQTLLMSTMSTLWLAAIEVVLIAGVWYGSLKSSHKIAGPVYVFSREVTKLGQGDLTAHIKLRQKDMFRDTAAEMNKSFSALRSRLVTIKELGQQLEEACSQGSDTQSLVNDLQAELAKLTTEDDEQ